MNQHEAFLDGEGDNYYDRNFGKPINRRVVNACIGLGLQQPHMLEIGCSDGRYLDEIARYNRGTGTGLDPSSKAIKEGQGKYPDLSLYRGAARDAGILFDKHEFDLIIHGFYLYLLDRDDLLDIVSDTDFLLKPGGFMAVHDFDVLEPETVSYKYVPGIYTYKMYYPGLWLASYPRYRLVSTTPTGDDTAITILQKARDESSYLKSVS